MLGIAVCATYATGALVLLDGLEVGSESVLERLDTGPFLAYRGVFPQLEPFDIDGTLRGLSRAGWLRSAELVTETAPVGIRVLALADGSLGGSGPSPGTTFGSLALPPGSGVTDTLVLRTELGTVEITVEDSEGMGVGLPDTWLLISEVDLRRLATWEEDTFDLLFVELREDARGLAGAGFSVLSLTSAPDFFGAVLQEARRLVGGLVGVSAVAIAAVAYSLISLDIRYRRPETRTLLAVGMDGRGLGRLYGFQLAFTVVGGTLLGVAGGIAAANALVSFAPLFGLPTVISPHLSLTGLMLPLATSLGAGLMGGGLSLLQNLRRWNRAPRH